MVWCLKHRGISDRVLFIFFSKRQFWLFHAKSLWASSLIPHSLEKCSLVTWTTQTTEIVGLNSGPFKPEMLVVYRLSSLYFLYTYIFFCHCYRFKCICHWDELLSMEIRIETEYDAPIRKRSWIRCGTFKYAQCSTKNHFLPLLDVKERGCT